MFKHFVEVEELKFAQLNLTQCAAPQTDMERIYPQQSSKQLLYLKGDRGTQLVKLVGLLFPTIFLLRKTVHRYFQKWDFY